ncbi:hypothetical protein [Hyphomonas sp.]|uniref:hypothetical protein n=1 Tax=Hyphomonas sp. TaxID=87 RepID=UPI00391A129E
MFARRPRYDDTFGVRMDLGADRIDPMSLRPKGAAGQLRVKAPVIVEQPGSLFDIFAGRSKDPFSQLRERPRPQVPDREPLPPEAETRRAPPARAPEPGERPRTFEDGLRAIWQRLSVTQRIGLSLFAGWFLLATGLWVIAAGIAIVVFTRRKRPG